LDLLGLHFTPLAGLVLPAAVAVAYFLKGFSGFGPALIFVPVVSVVFTPALALSGSAFVDLIVGAGLAGALRSSRDELRLVGRMAVAMGCGTVAGAVLAGLVDTTVLLTLIGATVLLLGVQLIVRPAERLGSEPVPGFMTHRVYAACLAGGLTGGLVGISGPFIVAAAASLEKSVFRRVLVLLFLVESVIKVVVYALVGIWSEQVLSLTLLAGPAILLGLVLGYRAHLHVDQRRFTLAVGALLTLIGAEVLLSTYL
jgi:uncharacterized membrane protein YfcA